MAWSTSIPLISDDISADLTAIRENFGVLNTAWQGDHKALAGTGAASNTHAKVTLPQDAAPPAVADAGILYTKATGGAPELFYRNVAGGEAQLTSGGSTAGAADVFCVFDGSEYEGVAPNQTIKAAAIKNSKNVTSIGYISAGSYKINFTNNLIGTDYVVQITAASGSVNQIAHAHNYSRLASSFSFLVHRSSTGGGTSNPYNSKDINVAIFRNG